MAYVRWISTVPGVNMKRKLIVILSLVLCFMLSCNEETLDKVFIQGGMDAASPRVIVAVDPDSVHSFLEGEITTLDKEEIREEIALDEKEESQVEKVEEYPSLYSLSPDVISGMKAYLDSSLSSQKEEILGYVEEETGSVLSSLSDVEALIDKALDDALLYIEGDVKSKIDEELTNLKSETKSYMDEELTALKSETKSYLDEELSFIESEARVYFEGEISGLKDDINNSIIENQEQLDTLSEDFKAYLETEALSYIEARLALLKDEILSSLEKNYETKGVDVHYIEDAEIEFERATEEDADITLNGIYLSSGEEGYVVIGYEDGISSLVIPESIDGVPVVAIGERAFRDCSTLNGDVVLPKSIVAIEKEAFMNADGLNGRIYFPQSLKVISDRAFYGCQSLQGDLIIPDSVETIGDEAFSYCTGIGSAVYGGRGLKSVGRDIFTYSGVTKCHLPLPISLELGF